MGPDPEYEYVLYIDEAGDDGLAKIKPIDADGASEWLCIGGLLIRSHDESNVVSWVKRIRNEINARQGPVLHFRKLSPAKRKKACEAVSKLLVRAFVVCSNKKNMKGHKNERAAKRGGKQWFYNYCVRLLMERVTELVFTSSMKRHGAPSTLRVIFSQRGGHSYGQTKAYWELLKAQASGGSTFLKKREIRHQVLRFSLVDYVPHYQNAGLQLADVIASAFFRAIDLDTGCDITGASALRLVMAAEHGVIADFGVTLQPTPPCKAHLRSDQQRLFALYGYTFE